MVDALYILRNTGLWEHIQTSYHCVQSSSQISPDLFYSYTFLSPNNLQPNHAEFLNIEWTRLALIKIPCLSQTAPSILNASPPLFSAWQTHCPSRPICHVTSLQKPSSWLSLTFSHSFLHPPIALWTCLCYTTCYIISDWWASISPTRPRESSHLVLCCIPNTSCGAKVMEETECPRRSLKV